MNENELSRQILGIAIDIHHAPGPGLPESAYKECLFYKIKKVGLYAEKEKPMPLIYEVVKLDSGYRIDILVEKKLVLKIKSVEALNEVHFSQTLAYLKPGKYKSGLLMNFNVSILKDGIRRIANNL